MRKRTQAPTRLDILNNIGDNFQGIMQWRRALDPSWSENVTANFHQAETLIGLLEVNDCGSFGGFDKNQPRPRNLFDRWDWLFRKYNNPEGKRFGCKIVSYEDIRNYFSRERG